LQEYRLTNKSRLICGVILATLLAFSISATAAENVAGSNAEKATEKAVEKTIAKAVEKTIAKAVEKTIAKAVEKTIEKATAKAVEKAVEQATEKALEKAAGKPLEQEERPEKWKGPTKVHFFIFVIDIDAIDGSKQSFSANFHIRLRWKDKRLAEKTDSIRRIALEKIWSPRMVLVNQGGNVWESLPKVADITPDGTVTYTQRYVGPLSQALMLSNFPMDEHRFTIQFAGSGHGNDALEFVPIVQHGFSGGGISEKLSLTDWGIVNFEALSSPYNPAADVNVPGFAFQFTAKRHFLYYLWQVTLPLSLIVMMSLGVFWIARSNAGAQIGLATSSMLALITYRFILAGMLPRLPYMTRMDYFTLGSTLLVFLALIGVILTASLSHYKYDRLAHATEKLARFAFPALFLLIFGWFLSGLWKH